MTDAEIQILKGAIVATSAYYQIKLDPQVIAMYAEDLSDLPIDLVLEGYKKWRKNPKNFRFPLPAQIRSQFDSTVSEEDIARDVAGRIVASISRYGYSNPEAAREYIGELGWKIVERQGGWQAICGRTMNDELTTYQAQWAKQVISVIHFHQSGLGDEPPQLPATNNEHIEKRQSLLELMKVKSVNEVKGVE